MLHSVNSPDELKAVPQSRLPELATEIRCFLIENIAKTGGHLAPNLGIVELTLALHRTYSTPKDKIIWDVGHQAYVHKILTGRKHLFSTLRQKDGIAGFPKIKESPHDAFGAGHASTSLSAALGMATARDLKGEDFKVVAVIGDGSLTGGMAFEALNQIGYLQKKMVIILNDNKMSIDNNVGALAKYTQRITRTEKYRRVKEKIDQLIKRHKDKELRQLKGDLKSLTTPGIVFEKLGISYIGPIDGHKLTDIESALKQANQINGPVLIHAKTTKGKGLSYAEEHADKYHGVGPFVIESGKAPKKTAIITYTEAFAESLIELAKQDKRIVAITAAMPSGTGLSKFKEVFPKRCFDVGIAEQHAVTFAAGLATQGLRPVVAIYSTFLQRAFDQIIHDVAIQKLPIIFAIDRAGLVGEDGPTHHGVFDLSYLRLIPNMVVSAPKDESELRDLLSTATKHDGPFAIRYPRGAALGIPTPHTPQLIPIGQAQILQEGDDINLIAIGNTVHLAEQAHTLLKDQGISATVINTRFVKPLDPKIIEQAKLRPSLIIEENTQIGGLTSALQEHSITNLQSLALADRFIEHGNVNLLRKEQGISLENIMLKTKQLLQTSSISTTN
ncbi:1-deoxy-D-xylulose-5-phosphate synthase [Candidatus Woesearchaeota archaeon]|nr:1-deoxy-D-xylulose-5-phosphate synthase [Candidatus Woesearchaeota archaeon]